MIPSFVPLANGIVSSRSIGSLIQSSRLLALLLLIVSSDILIQFLLTTDTLSSVDIDDDVDDDDVDDDDVDDDDDDDDVDFDDDDDDVDFDDDDVIIVSLA